MIFFDIRYKPIFLSKQTKNGRYTVFFLSFGSNNGRIPRVFRTSEAFSAWFHSLWEVPTSVDRRVGGEHGPIFRGDLMLGTQGGFSGRNPIIPNCC